MQRGIDCGWHWMTDATCTVCQSQKKRLRHPLRKAQRATTLQSPAGISAGLVSDIRILSAAKGGHRCRLAVKDLKLANVACGLKGAPYITPQIRELERNAFAGGQFR